MVAAGGGGSSRPASSTAPTSPMTRTRWRPGCAVPATIPATGPRLIMASPAWIPAAMEPNSRRASAGFTSHDPQGPDHGDAALPGERERSRHAVARGAGDRERGEALPALAEPGVVGPVGDEGRDVDRPRHAGDRRDVARVDRCGVPETVLRTDGEIDGGVDIRNRGDRHHRHHLLGPHQIVIVGDHGDEKPGVAVDVDPGCGGDVAGVLPDPRPVDHAGLAGRTHRLEDDPFDLAEFVLLEDMSAVAAHGPDEFVTDRLHRDRRLLARAYQVVVERGTGDDVPGGAIDVG